MMILTSEPTSAPAVEEAPLLLLPAWRRNFKGGDGGGPLECYNRYYENSERLVALSTGWYNGGSRCGKFIKIKANNGRTTTTKVVDECDSRNGCDEEHAGQPPCKNNIVDGLDAVWSALGLNKDIGIVDVTWSMA
ncbi:hypothetical protein FEM48_Zijuj02G0097900 [Ziziphus jujuba var. spinosa]|uniref:Uncharacterized protein n=1 Tax=Ziziphus jujuba var. spinosa TaxID=714518 RepID=A0A978VV17_ZIZJJ|nr:hypothetical protein FEM48_Zijuj02G0097900 [Ziziphus jujuba var. spinosa]